MSISDRSPGTDPEAGSVSSEELGRFVRELAHRTGELQLSRYQEPGEISEKAPKDLVTEVDILCEEFLISEISERYPDDAILSEERGGEISRSGRTWLLDPVDGTANFARANPLFCVCISVVEGDEVKHTAVAAPRLGDVYHATSGAGAFRVSASGETYPLHVAEAETLEDSFVGADISYRGSNNPANNILEVFRSCWQVRSIGSAGIRGAWLAAGYLDVSVGTRNTAWDYAPTVLLVSEAGGRATDLDGSPWTIDSRGLIATNGAVHDEVLGALAAG